MKSETIVKVLKRYVKSLKLMENEALSYSQLKDAQRYEFDRNAFE